ncbi:nuclease [Tepidimonas sediminis]|uniref:Nuclease n=1 Tax=Tepidimonas sediminis TaxID=2588941 RepID=A0A554WPG5_9BURK|nr:thermonuclease family protein [Tepidimonas sediminis]TSE25471.1 nuclease [Tepidimonas sediminis]
MGRANGRPRGRWLLALLLAGGLAACGGPAPPLQATAPADAPVVVAVHDGDTLRVRDAHGRVRTVRLAAIDAPELDQPGGAQAQAALQGWTLGRAVTLQERGDDRHGRRLAVVWRLQDDGSALELNLALLQQGWAWHYRAHADEQPLAERWRYAAAELAARRAGRGLWADPDAIPPWEWRRLKRRSPAPSRRAGAARTSGSCPCWSWAARRTRPRAAP